MALVPNSIEALRSRLQSSAADCVPEARPHLEAIQAQLEAIARGDLDAVLLHAHDDVTLEIFAPPEFPWIRQARGIAALRAALEQNFGSVRNQRPEIRDIFAEGETVILFGRERGTIAESAQDYDVEFVQRFTFRAGGLAAVRMVAAHSSPL
jgi:ketosteroid isomerase-like protein